MAFRDLASARQLDRFPFPSTAQSLRRQSLRLGGSFLDRAQTGPLYLRNDAIATIVVELLFRGDALAHYQLGPWVIVANHIHALLLPRISPSLLLKSLKGSAAREANRLLHRTDEQFWQRESYDHGVRNDNEWNRIANSIEGNPVKAARTSAYATNAPTILA